MDANLYDSVKARLQALPRKEWDAIARESAVPFGTLYRYAHGYVTRPTYTALTNLDAALKARE